MMNDPDSSHPAPVIEVSALTRLFGRRIALDMLNLSVPRGVVFGLVGENGAGKTTLVKLLLGLLRPTAGSVRVFGLDPVAAPVEVLSPVGYLSEDRDLPGWMRVRELVDYTRAFYPGWDDAYAEELRHTFGLDLPAKIKHLSRGERAKVGLLAALAYRPELLVLDEPSSGLDAVVRRHILGAIIRTVADEGRTVFFSSHLLDEVERVADYVAMIHKGKLVLCGRLDEIKGRHHRLTVRFDEPRERPPTVAHALGWDGSKREWTLICDGQLEEVRAGIAGLNARIVEEATPSLEEVFVARVGGASRAAGREG